MKNIVDTKYSDSHVDLLTPWQDKDKNEYETFDPQKGFSRWNSLSVLESRSKQVLSWVLQTEASEKDYLSLLSNSLKKYDTVFASVFSHWQTMDLVSKRRFVDNSIQAYDSIIKENPDITVVKSLEWSWLVQSLDDFKKLADVYWIQSFMLQYNNPNSLVGEDTKLTPLGWDVAKYALNNNIYLDLAHTQPLARKEIITQAINNEQWSLLQYSHGWTVNTISKDKKFGKIATSRGISEDELDTVIKNGWLVCITPTKPFFQSLKHIVETIDTYAQKHGEVLLGIWSDMWGLPPQLIIDNMDSIEKLHNSIGDKLVSYNFSSENIDALFRRNVRDWNKNNSIVT